MTKQSGLLIDETRKISERDRRRIDASLRKRLRKGVDLAGVLAEIESATQYYWASIKAEQQQQQRSQIARELSRVAECAATFPQGAAELSAALEGLGGDADEALEQHWQRRAEPYLDLENLRNSLCRLEVSDDLRKRIRQLMHAARDFQPRSRPRQDAAGDLINWLALIYEGATGKWPARTWDPSGYRGRERHPYFEACFRAAGMSAKDSKKKLAMVRPILEARKTPAGQRTRSRGSGQSKYSRNRINTA